MAIVDGPLSPPSLPLLLEACDVEDEGKEVGDEEGGCDFEEGEEEVI